MIIPVLTYPDERLRIKAKPVKQVDAVIQGIIDNMFETMYAEQGIGLAATQIDHHQRIIVMDVPTPADYEALKAERESDELPTHLSQKNPICLINPVLLNQTGKTQFEEGCLSVPEFSAMVSRAEKITVSALDKTGQPFELSADGLLAVCIQHEMDHLVGKLFIDHLSKLKQMRLKKRLVKL